MSWRQELVLWWEKSPGPHLPRPYPLSVLEARALRQRTRLLPHDILRLSDDFTYEQRRHPSSFDGIEQLNGEFFKHDNITYGVLRSMGVLTTPPLNFTATSPVSGYLWLPEYRK